MPSTDVPAQDRSRPKTARAEQKGVELYAHSQSGFSKKTPLAKTLINSQRLAKELLARLCTSAFSARAGRMVLETFVEEHDVAAYEGFKVITLALSHANSSVVENASRTPVICAGRVRSLLQNRSIQEDACVLLVTWSGKVWATPQSPFFRAQHGQDSAL